MRRSGRKRKHTKRYAAYLDEQATAFIAHEALEERNPLHSSSSIKDIFAFTACGIYACAGRSLDPDTMYMHEALQAHDAEEFKRAMNDEIKTHEKQKHWELMKRKDLPPGTPVLPAVWAMKRKRRVATNECYKHKARLNFGGHKQEKFVNFWQTYSPVVGWTTIRFFLILALITSETRFSSPRSFLVPCLFYVTSREYITNVIVKCHLTLCALCTRHMLI